MIVEYWHNCLQTDYAGETIKNMKVIKPAGRQDGTGRMYWWIECYCGNWFFTRLERIRCGTTKSCGCHHKATTSKRLKGKTGRESKSFIDLTGFVINGLEFIEFIDQGKSALAKWRLRCFCGNYFIARASHIKEGRTKSCKCLTKRKGPYHPLYKNIKAPKRIEVSTPEYKNWRKNVFARDRYSCVRCKSKKGIQAHHLDGWKWCIDRRYDESNGVCICSDCHKWFHKIYGKGKNTEQQFKEWINEKEAA